MTFQAEDDATARRQLEDALRVYDKDGNGSVSTSDIKAAFASLGEPLTYEQMDDVFDGMADKVDPKGYIAITDFISVLLAKK